VAPLQDVGKGKSLESRRRRVGELGTATSYNMLEMEYCSESTENNGYRSPSALSFPSPISPLIKTILFQHNLPETGAHMGPG
jgi:hypothetical protein